jgi:uncharacterized protein YbcV (DUF1398 family)
LTKHAPVVTVGAPLESGTVEVLIAALRTDQAGNSAFPQFLASSWHAGVVRSDGDFAVRNVAYCGCDGARMSRTIRPSMLNQSTGA